MRRRRIARSRPRAIRNRFFPSVTREIHSMHHKSFIFFSRHGRTWKTTTEWISFGWRAWTVMSGTDDTNERAVMVKRGRIARTGDARTERLTRDVIFVPFLDAVRRHQAVRLAGREQVGDAV